MTYLFSSKIRENTQNTLATKLAENRHKTYFPGIPG